MDPETLVGIAIHIALILLFLILGIVLWKGKGAWMIAGYNTSSEAEKSKYDEKSLCRFVAKLMFFYAACFAVSAVCTCLNSTTIYYCVMALFLIVTIAALIYANTGNRFKKK